LITRVRNRIDLLRRLREKLAGAAKRPELHPAPIDAAT
jgi:hypothetical protein